METKLRFKVGDKVRVKSLEWYNSKLKNRHGIIQIGVSFNKSMSWFCGKEITIRDCENSYYRVLENAFLWQDWMLEDEVVAEEKQEQLNKNYMKEILTKEMTKEEVYSFLRDTEIVCNSIEESKKVQEKLFALGTSYSLRDVVPERGLLFITEDLCISNSIDYDYFLSHNLRRVDPSEILAIQIKEEEKPKFDPNTLQDFDKVLVREEDTNKWRLSFFDTYESGYFYCTDYIYTQCVPYNEETKLLKGTTDEAPEYYQIWK